jgi:MFS transporter, Spinster family, sphingosine-1-phosphate transporter
MGLGFYNTESAASTIFGIIVSIAGIIATPLGGWIVDILQGISTDQQRQSYQTISTENKIIQSLKSLENVCAFMYWMSLISTLLFSLAFYSPNRITFLSLMGFAAAVNFSTNASVTFGQLESVSFKYRSFSLAIGSLIGHVFGDVPSPILFGLLKDYLAPDCVAHGNNNNNNDTTNNAISDECRSESIGLRWCILIISLWLYWSVIFYGIAWWLCSRDLSNPLVLNDSVELITSRRLPQSEVPN